LTGVETISHAVPALRKPKSRNAATTLALLGGISAVMTLPILFLARATGVHYAEDPHTQLALDGEPLPADYVQHPVLGQLAETVFSGVPVLFYVVSAVTGGILVLAANTAATGFPVLGLSTPKHGAPPR